MKEKNIEKVVKIDQCLMNGDYMADGQRIKQVITNLLSNALKFTFSGSIAIEVMKVHEEDENFQG